MHPIEIAALVMACGLALGLIVTMFAGAREVRRAKSSSEVDEHFAPVATRPKDAGSRHNPGHRQDPKHKT